MNWLTVCFAKGDTQFHFMTEHTLTSFTNEMNDDHVNVETYGPLVGKNIRFTADRRFADFVHSDIADLLARPHLPSVLQDVLGSQRFVDGMVLEFGVFSGKTINLIADAFPDRKIFGFDSFEGLPTDWQLTGTRLKVSKAVFHTHDLLPDVAANVDLVKGYFSDTLPTFLATSTEAISFVHVDCDLYSSTRDVLELCGDRFVPGTVIVFDEFFDYLNEARAFFEFIDKSGLKFEWLGHGGDSAIMQDANAVGLMRKNMSWSRKLLMTGLSLRRRSLRGNKPMPAAAAVVIV